MPADVATINRWTAQLEARWQSTHDRWRNWEAMVKRELRPVIDPKMGNLAHGADYRTADLLKELKRCIAFICTASWDFEGKPGKASPVGRDEAKNAELWFRAWWAQVNRGGWLNEVFAAGQAMPGVTTVRMLTRNLEEPEEGIDREEWMKTRDQVWYFRDVPTTTVRWDPVNDSYNRIVMDYELSVAEAREQFKVDGADIGKDKGKQYVPIHDKINKSGVGWAGDDYDPDHEETDEGKKIRVTVVEYRDPDKPCPICPDRHPLWVGAEYVRDSQVKSLKDAEQVREYVLPYKNWPSLRICEGDTWPGQTDPLWRYCCMMYDLIINAEALNWIESMLQTVANFDMSRGDILRLVNLAPEMLAGSDLLRSISATVEPNTVDDKADVLPGEPVRWPPHLTTELLTWKDTVAQRFDRSKINPVLFGEAFDEARQAPGTTFALLLRQARAPFDRPLKKQAQFVLDVAEDVMHAVLFMDHEETRETEQRFYVSLVGEEGGEAGDQLYLSASKLATHPQVYIKPNAEQLAEQQARYEAEWMDYTRGIIDWNQVLEGRGYKDVDAQNARIDEDRQRRELQPMLDNAMKNYALQIAADTMETDPSLLIQNPFAVAAQPQPGAMGGDGLPSPTVRPPALNAPNQGPSPTGGV